MKKKIIVISAIATAATAIGAQVGGILTKTTDKKENDEELGCMHRNMLRLADDCRDLNERLKLIETWICSKCNECDMECNLDDLFDDEEDNKDE